MSSIPHLALSVRQPWAWAIIHGGKDVENRTRFAIDKGGMREMVGKRIAIHAGKGMTQDEYHGALVTFGEAGAHCPMPDALLRGGIIGTVEVVDVISTQADLRDKRAARSPWFFGPCALVLSAPLPVDFVGSAGQLGMFAWMRNNLPPDAPAKWMLPKEARDSERTADAFVEIVRAQLRKRGVDGAGVASITVKNNRARLNWLWCGKACSVSLDAHYDRYRGGFDFHAGLEEAIDKAFMSEGSP